MVSGRGRFTPRPGHFSSSRRQAVEPIRSLAPLAVRGSIELFIIGCSILVGLRISRRQHRNTPPGGDRESVVGRINCGAFGSPEVCAAYQRTRARWRGALADQLADEGVVDLIGDPQTVAALLTALGRGLAVELRADTELELESTVAVARCLVYAALSN